MHCILCCLLAMGTDFVYANSIFQEVDLGIPRATMSANGKYLLSLSERLRITVWDAESGRQIATRAVGDVFIPLGPRGIVFHPIRHTAIIADGSGFIEWDWSKKPAMVKPLFAADANTKESILNAKNTLFLDISPDGKRIAIFDTSSDIQIQDVPDGKPVAIGKAHYAGSGTQRVYFIPGTKQLCANDIDKVQIFDWVEKKSVGVLKGHTQPITTLHVSPDGKQILTGSLDGTIRIWDVNKQKSTGSIQLKKDDELPITARFSPDGSLLVCGQGAIISVFQAKDLKPITSWNGPRSGATEILVTKDNRTVITFGEGLRPRYWDVQLGKEKDTQ